LEKLKKIVLDNFFLKILSLIVAFLLWLNVSQMQKTKVEFVSYIDVRNIPQGYTIKKISPEKVIIVVEGFKNKLGKVEISKIQAYVDASKLREGQNILPVKIEGNLKSFKVKLIKPDKIVIYARKNN